ncbi:hypothetical protein ABPG73_017726 [Tetrahymena malaccensis]
MSTYMLLSNIELISFVTFPFTSGQISINFWEPIQNIQYGSIQMKTEINVEIPLKNLIGIKKYLGYDYAFIYLVSDTLYLYDLSNYQSQQYQLLSSFTIDQLYSQYGLDTKMQLQEKFFSGLLISQYIDFLRVTTFDTNGNNFVLKFQQTYNNNAQQLVISYYFNQNNWTQLANNPQSEYIYIINDFNYTKYYIGEDMNIQRNQQYFSQHQSSYIASRLVNFDGEERQIIINNQINQIQIADKYGNSINQFSFDMYTVIPKISFSFQEVINQEKNQFSIKINSTQLLVFDADNQSISYFNVSLSPLFNWNNQPEFYQVIFNPQTNQTYFYIVNGLTKQLSRVKLIINQTLQTEIFDQSNNLLLSPGFSVFTQQQIAVALSSNQVIQYDLQNLSLKSLTKKGYSLNPLTTELNQFLVFQSKYNVLGLQFTVNNMLFINTDQQNIQFDAFGCLSNNQCVFCELQVFFNSSSQNQGFVDNFGLGDLNYQYTTYQNFILGFLQAHQLLQFVKTIQTIQIHYFINNSNEMQIDQNQIEFPTKQKVILIIEPIQIYGKNSIAVVNISGDFSLSLFQAITFRNIIFQFSNQYQQQDKSCSLNLQNIQSISTIDNAYIVGGSEQDEIYCFNFKIFKSNVEFKNLNLQNLNLSNHSSLFTATSQEEFSLFVSESFTNLILEDINIINNNSSKIDSFEYQTPSYLFQSSAVSIKNMKIQKNVFYNLNIIYIQCYIYVQEIQMNIQDIYISDNTLNQIQSAFFMQALYDEIQVPSVLLNIQNIIISNNSLPELTNYQFIYDIYIFQIQNILNISIQNISLIDNYNFGLGTFRKAQLLDINNLNCTFTNTYQIKSIQIPSSSCLTIEDGSQIKIKNFILDQKILNDNYALSISSPGVSSQVLIENIKIQNILIFQSGTQIFAEPIYINLNFGNNVQINNLIAYNCSLIGISFSSVSTPILYILNLKGEVNIYQANLQRIYSNTINNGLVINANYLGISSSFFQRFFYIDQQSLNNDQLFYNLSDQIQILGSCFQFIGMQLLIQNSQFNETQSNKGGFGYLQNLINNQIYFKIINSTFSHSATNFQGSIFQITLQQGTIDFEIINATFHNIFSLNNQNPTLTLKNIYGSLSNVIFSFYNSQLQCSNITIIEDRNENIDIKNFVYQNILQFSSVFYLMNSQAELQSIFFNQIQTLIDISQTPLLIYGEQNCIVKLIKCLISNSLFTNQGLIYLKNSVFQSSDIKIQNMTFAIPYRRYIQKAISQKVFLNSNFISMISSNAFLNLYNVSYINCKTCYGGFMHSQNSSLTITQSTFYDLNGAIGGAIYLSDYQNTLIQDCSFQQIQAYYDGGALTLRSIKCYLNKSIVGQGGCIYIEMSQNNQNILMQNNLIEQNYALVGGGISYSNTVIFFQNNTIQNNFAKSYGNNTFFAPSYLEYQSAVIDTNAEITFSKDLLIIKNVQSGFNIQELKFALKDENGQQIFYEKYTPNYLKSIQNPLTINQTLSNSSYYILGSLESYYNDDSQQFIFKCYVGYTPQIGNNGIPQCIPCKDGSYSFNQIACLKCPIGGMCIKYEKDIRIQDGYWRLNSQDDDIILCQNKMDNCVARNHTLSGNDICKIGYVGALCESCDFYGEKWRQRYTKIGQYQCALCKVSVYNILKLTFIYIGIILYISISIRSYINQTRKFILCYTAIKLSKSKQNFKDQSHSGIDVILKILGTYIQNIFAISQLQINFPNTMPVSQTSYDFDCALLSLNSKIPISYLRLFFSFIIPIVFLIGYIITAIVLKLFRSNCLINFPKHSIVPAILLIVLYTQPNLLYQLVLLGSCRKIGSQYYTNENSNLKCYDEFGFLYKEYKSQFYYWEFIKIIQKTVIMIVLSFFQQLYATKGYLVLFTILIYQTLCFKLQPYKKPEINQLDFMQASVCSFSIFISLMQIFQNSPEIANQYNMKSHSNRSVDENIQTNKKIQNKIYEFQIQNLDLEAKNCQYTRKK